MEDRAEPVVIPQWDLADRMRKALRTSDVGVQEMATYLGVARNTVSTWINGRISPSRQTLRLWALRCGVPYEWLVGGLAEVGADVQFRCTALPHPRLRLVPAQVTGLTRRMPLVSRPAEGLPRRSAHLTLVPRAQFLPTADAVPA